MTRLEIATRLICRHPMLDLSSDYGLRDRVLDEVFELADLMMTRNEKFLHKQYEAAPKCTRCGYPEGHHGIMKIYACSTFTLAKRKK